MQAINRRTKKYESCKRNIYGYSGCLLGLLATIPFLGFTMAHGIVLFCILGFITYFTLRMHYLCSDVFFFELKNFHIKNNKINLIISLICSIATFILCFYIFSQY